LWAPQPKKCKRAPLPVFLRRKSTSSLFVIQKTWLES
jgi:hypothetical protein